MEVQVRITEILEPQSFLGKDGVTTYTRYSFLGTTFGDFPRVIYFQTLGQDKFSQMNIQVGGIYTISFDIEARQYNGKYFTSINAWRATRETDANVAQPQTQANANSQAPSPVQQPAYGGYAHAPQPATQTPNVDPYTPF